MASCIRCQLVFMEGEELEYCEEIDSKALQALHNHIFEYMQRHDNRPRQCVRIDLQEEGRSPVIQGEIQEKSIKKDLMAISNLTHLYKDIFCIHYALLLKRNQIIALRQPAIWLGSQTIEKYKLFERTIERLLAKSTRLLSAKVRPVIVKREGKYLVRLGFHRIEPHTFIQLNSQQPLRVEKISLPLDEPPKDAIVDYQSKMKTMMMPSRLVVGLEKSYYNDTSIISLNKKPPPKFNQSGSYQITIRDENNQYKEQDDEFIQDLVFNSSTSAFNPECRNFVFNPTLGSIYLLGGPSKYYNFYHFRDLVKKSSKKKERKAIKPENIRKKFEKIPLTFSLPPLYNMDIIEIPCRGEFCEHLQFYELRALYFSKHSSSQGEFFACPVCKKKLTDTNVIIIQDAFDILEMLRYHQKQNNYDLYKAFLAVDHKQQTVEYSYASDSSNLFVRTIDGLYDRLIDPLYPYYDRSNLWCIRRDKGFVHSQ